MLRLPFFALPFDGDPEIINQKVIFTEDCIPELVT